MLLHTIITYIGSPHQLLRHTEEREHTSFLGLFSKSNMSSLIRKQDFLKCYVWNNLCVASVDLAICKLVPLSYLSLNILFIT